MYRNWGECDCVWRRCDYDSDWWDSCFKEKEITTASVEEEKE